MNPWWKRPSSESSSSASREADQRTRPSRSESDDEGSSSGSGRSRGRRGGRGRSPDRNAKSDTSENSSANQSERGNRRGGRGGGRGGRGQRSAGSQRRGGRRPSPGRRNDNGTVALLVDVDALHKALKAAERNPEEAAGLFANVGPDVARRAIASGSRKQKAQAALSDLGFDVEQVDGGTGAARLRLALDAMELALSNRGAKLYLLGDDATVGRIADENALLEARLRHHGADVTYFGVQEPLTLGAAASDDNRQDDDADEQDDDATNGAAKASGDDERDGARSGGRRRRRRGRRGRSDEADGEGDSSAEAADDNGDEGRAAKPRTPRRSQPAASKPAARKSTSDPLALLTAAIGKLIEGESQLVWATKVRQVMSGLDPMFNELDHGYDDFEALLREAERRGRITLQKDPRTSTFVIVGWRAA